MKQKKVILPLLVTCFVCFAGFSQQAKIDSLKKALPSLKDTARIECLLNLCTQYIFLELSFKHMCEPCRDSIYLFSNTAFEESKRLNYYNGMARSFNSKAALKNHFLSDYPAMEALARESLNWFSRTGNKKLIEITYWQLGIALSRQYKVEESVSAYREGYEWAEKHQNISVMRHCIGPGYEFYRNIGEYDKAFEQHVKSQQLKLRYDGQIDTTTDYYVLAELHRRVGNNAAALNYYHQFVKRIDLNHDNIWYRVSYPELFALNGKMDSALYYYRQIDTTKLNRQDINYFLLSIGEFNLINHQFKQAIGHLLRSLAFYRGFSDINARLRNFIDLARAYAALGQYNETLLFVREALDLSVRHRSRQYTQDAYEILYDVHKKRNQADSAFFYFEKYVAQKQKVDEENVKGKFVAYDYEQKLTSLEKEKHLQQQRTRATAQQRNYLLGGIVLTFVMGIILLRIIMLKRKNEQQRRVIAENELKLNKFKHDKIQAELEQQAAELEMQALRAQMNPHFIFNSLNSINRFILQNNKAQASEYLAKFSRLVRMILQNSQASLITLESELESLKLYLDLESLRFEYHFTYNISVPKDLDIEILKVPPLIIQPFAENAIWHGLMHKEEKGFLQIDIRQQGSDLFLKINDNGIGRKQATQLASKSTTRHKSMGLKITADRIAMIQRSNGTGPPVIINDLVNADGSAAGTEVTIKLPVIYD